MHKPLSLYSTVRLTEDLNPWLASAPFLAGATGTVVMVHDGGGAYEVEFSEPERDVLTVPYGKLVPVPERAFRPIFLDFEASSLNPESYPIEIGWVDASGQGESHLIRPESGWIDWSDASERIHGIGRNALIGQGLPAATVAKRAEAAFRGAVLFSDNSTWETHWLTVLFRPAKLGIPIVVQLEDAFRHETDRLPRLNHELPGTTGWHETQQRLFREANILADAARSRVILEAGRQTHRALPDALLMWKQWREVKRAVEARLSALQSASEPG